VFERFTQQARRVVERGHGHARSLGHHWVGTEHLLLGVYGETTVASRALEALGIEAGRVRDDIERLIGLGRPPESGRPDAAALAEVGIDLEEVRRKAEEAFGAGALENTTAWRRRTPFCFTRRAKKALDLALREALRLRQGHVGPEHVLLGLVRREDGLAAEILSRRAGSLAAVRSAVLHELRRPA
jgi:ATP-dependent Clp protease ATP-binding subunit ClpA